MVILALVIGCSSVSSEKNEQELSNIETEGCSLVLRMPFFSIVLLFFLEENKSFRWDLFYKNQE
jgi:hypothetical protein